MLGEIVVPSNLQIDSWNSINEPPIVETAPRIVPLPVYISPSSEGYYNRNISVKADTLGSSQIKKIRDISNQITLTDEFIKECYTRRSIGRPLLDYIEKIKQSRNIKTTPDEFKTQEASNIAMRMLTPLIEIFRNIKANAEQLSEWFLAEFQNVEFWEDAQYTDTYLLKLCTLIYKIFCIENLIPYKQGLIDDVSTLLKFINDPTFATDITMIRAWMMNFGSNTNMIYDKLSSLPYTTVQLIFDVIYNFVHDHIVQKKYIQSDTKFALISSFLFIIQWYTKAYQKEQMDIKKSPKPKKVKQILKPIPLNVKLFARDLMAVHKTLMLSFEIAPELSQFFPPGFLDLSKKEKTMASEFVPQSEQDLLDNAHKTFHDVSHLIADVVSTEKTKSYDSLAKDLPECLRKIGETLSFLFEKLELRRLEQPAKIPPEITDQQGYALYQYEEQMSTGLLDILDRFLPLLMMCRTTKEVITDNIDPVLRHINAYMQEYIQDFCVNKIPILINKKSELKHPLLALRTLLGYFPTKEALAVTKKTKEVKHLEYPEATPSVQLLELARVQLQIICNPGSAYTKKKGFLKGSIISEDEVAIMQKFIDDTYFFTDLLRLPEVIEATCDQSRLFFKERWLDMCKVSFFKIATSLPYILSNFALQNYQQTELTGAIFYPLSIYDDAAHTALHYLKSSLFYEEIKAEAEVCLVSITRLIADQSFHPIRSFIALRSMSQTMLDDLKKEGLSPQHSSNSPANRLGVLLQQNQLFVLGCPIDTKSLISQRLDELFQEALENILELIRVHGLLVIIAASRLIKILRDTHKMMMSFGIPMTPFNDIVSVVFCFDTPNSLQNKILLYIASYIQGPLLSDFYLLSTPNRLIPKLQPIIPLHSLFKKHDGTIIERILRPSCSCITIESFKELFRMVDDSSIALLHMNLITQINDVFQDFARIYQSLRGGVKRIRDAPLNSSSYQVFDRFFGAYRNFLHREDIEQVFDIMSEIGIIFAISEMMDSAFLLKKTSKELYTSYIFSRSPLEEDDHTTPELFELFDEKFKRNAPYFETYKKISTDKEKLPPFTYTAIHEFARLILESHLFNEESNNLVDLQSLNGFAAVWSVLEFLFTMTEVLAENTLDGSLCKYGESVLNCASIILSVTNQAELCSVLNIGDRILSHSDIGFTNSSDERLERYFKVNKLVSASIKCSLTSLNPFIEQLYGR